MKDAIYGLLLLSLLGGCKKTIEKKKEEAVIDAITSGYWLVTKYVKGSTDVTRNFSSYKFQFKENYTVDALKNNAFERSGTWQANAADQTINANFTNVTEPLSLLNGTWTITNSSWTSVDASQSINGENCRLHLDKE